jgi:3-dehydroquinate dehydratase, type II
MNILIINGPNLNFLGIREPNIYNSSTYDDLKAYLNQYATKNNINLEIFQSNYEGAIIDELQKAYFEKVDGIVINPGAFTHYSYSILDAIKSINIPTIEVHLTNINEREEFRKVSVIRDACLNTFMGKHFESYKDALDYLTKYLNEVKINEK